MTGVNPQAVVEASGGNDSSTGVGRQILELSEGREWPIAWLSLAITLAIYVALALALALFFPDPASPPAVAAATKAAEDFVNFPEVMPVIRPEPLEKARYLLGLLCLPILPSFFYLLGRRFTSRPSLAFLNRPGSLAVRDLLLSAALAAWFVTLWRSSEVPHIGSYFLVSLPVALLCVLFSRNISALPSAACWGVIGAVAMLGFLGQCVGENWFFRCPALWHHIEVVLAVVNQVAHGKTVLVDTTSQYGVLYPYVIAAVLSPFGVNVPGMSVVFAALVLLQSVLLFLAVSRLPGMTPQWKAAFAVAYAGLAVPGLSSALFPGGVLFHSRILDTSYDYTPVYLQFTPIRTIWFAVFVWLCSKDALFVHTWFVALGYILAGTSFLWNADTGLVILVAWTGMLIYRRLDGWHRDPKGLLRHVLIHVAALVGTVAGSLVFYALFARIRSGQFPRYDELFFFQKIFYQVGFYMWPMPLWEIWQPIVALLAFTIAWCLRRALCEQIPAAAPWLFFTAAYGLGAFSYYQGRSLPQVLPALFLPAFLLAFFWTRQGIAALSGRSFVDICYSADLRLIAITTLPVALFCVCGFVNLYRSLPAAVEYATNTTGTVNASDFEPIWDAIRPHVKGKAVAILADPEAFTHTKTGSWSVLPVASSSEIFLKAQVKEVQRAISSADTVVVVHPKMMPKWCHHLDLSAFKEIHSLVQDFKILQFDPAADRRQD